MQVTIKGYITSKESELFSDCADRYDYNETHHKFAISDGVSKSFFPKFWAEYLVEEFVSKEKVEDDTFLPECQEKWLRKITEIVNKPTVKWFTQNAFNKNSPALATFVGLQFFEKEKKWEASALGDSFLFFVPKKRKTFDDCFIISSKKEPIIFDNFPDYFSSIGEKFKGNIKKTSKRDLKDGTFYLMTDALAEWFINEKENAIGKIDVWENQKDFERFIDEERQSKKLGNDDSAILIINVDKVHKSKIKYTDNSVSDIYQLSAEQDIEIGKRESEVSKKKEAEKKELQRKEDEEKSIIVESEIKKESELVVEKEPANVENNKTEEEIVNNSKEKESTSKNDNPEVPNEKTEMNLEAKKDTKGLLQKVGDGLVKAVNFMAGSDTTNEKEKTIKKTKEVESKQENTEPNKAEKKENISDSSKTEIEPTKEIKKEPILRVKKSKKTNNITDKF